MRTTLIAITIVALTLLGSCKRQQAESSATDANTTAEEISNIPPLHPENIVSLAIASEDHTTLVTAIKAADYVTSVAASGPLTVFAPTNAAFDKLPEGTVEDLLKPENVGTLRKILQYHVTTSSLPSESFKDGQNLSMASGKKAALHVQDGQVSINDAKIVASVPASNGMLHVVDTVLLPPEN